jgi:hypothetical protein
MLYHRDVPKTGTGFPLAALSNWCTDCKLYMPAGGAPLNHCLGCHKNVPRHRFIAGTGLQNPTARLRYCADCERKRYGNLLGDEFEMYYESDLWC